MVHVTCQITISVEGVMSVDENIDTILLIENAIADTLSMKATFTAKLHTNVRDKQE